MIFFEKIHKLLYVTQRIYRTGKNQNYILTPPPHSTKSDKNPLSSFVGQNVGMIFAKLNSPARVLFEKLTVDQLVKKFAAVYGNRTFVIVFTTANRTLYNFNIILTSMPKSVSRKSMTKTEQVFINLLFVENIMPHLSSLFKSPLTILKED